MTITSHNELLEAIEGKACESECYTCARLAELVAENGALRARASNLEDERMRYKMQCERYETKLDELERENEKLSDREFYMRCCVVDMEGNVIG